MSRIGYAMKNILGKRMPNHYNYILQENTSFENPSSTKGNRKINPFNIGY
jgi:hypothetical protein